MNALPQIDHLAKLTYLFEVAADDKAPAGLKKAVLDYLHSDPGLGRVTRALEPLSGKRDPNFEELSDRARPIAQAGRVYGILAAFAEEMPPSTTLKQALTFASVAQGHYLKKTRQGDLKRSSDLVKDPLLSKNAHHTIHESHAEFFAPIFEQEKERSDDPISRRETPIRLSAKGEKLIRAILGRMRVSQTASDSFKETDTVETITDRFRDPR